MIPIIYRNFCISVDGIIVTARSGTSLSIRSVIRQLPVGTGMKRYRKVKLDTDDLISDEILLSDDDELVLSSEDESSSGLTEDNVAEEVLGMDDMADVDEEDDAIEEE